MSSMETRSAVGETAIDRHWRAALWLARFALAIAFLSAVVDRFGFWGQLGDPGVSWGTMASFDRHVAKLNPWVPAAWIPALSWFVTLLEAVLGVFLIAGIRLRMSALATALLLAVFFITMALFQGIKFPLNFNVLTAAACAYLVYLSAVPIPVRAGRSPSPSNSYPDPMTAR